MRGAALGRGRSASRRRAGWAAAAACPAACQSRGRHAAGRRRPGPAAGRTAARRPPRPAPPRAPRSAARAPTRAPGGEQHPPRHPWPCRPPAGSAAGCSRAPTGARSKAVSIGGERGRCGERFSQIYGATPEPLPGTAATARAERRGLARMPFAAPPSGGHVQGSRDLGKGRLLGLAHLDPAEAEEATLLGGFGHTLGDAQQPRLEGWRVLRRLGVQQRATKRSSVMVLPLTSEASLPARLARSPSRAVVALRPSRGRRRRPQPACSRPCRPGLPPARRPRPSSP